MQAETSPQRIFNLYPRYVTNTGSQLAVKKQSIIEFIQEKLLNINQKQFQV